MSRLKHAVRTNFDASADAYEAYESSSGRFAELASRLAERIDDVERALDAGAGTGASTRVFRERWDEVVALDASRAMLRCVEAPRLVGDFDRLPFDHGTFDVVAYAASIFLVDDPDDALAEAERVLRSGGRVVAAIPIDWRVDGEDPFANLERAPRTPASAERVTDAVDARFSAVETGEWTIDSSAADLRGFHRVPAMAARLYPKRSPDERVAAVERLLDDADLDGDVSQRWRWVVASREP